MLQELDRVNSGHGKAAISEEAGESPILQYGPVFESPVVEVKRHAPAATPHAVVLLDQPTKIRPGSFVQRLGVEAIHEMLENRMSLSLAPTEADC